MMKSLRQFSIVTAIALLAGCAANPTQQYRTPELTKASALNNQGYDRMAANDPNGAKPYFDQALALEPNLAIAHLNLGAVYQNTGRTSAAKEEYQLAIANDTSANDYPRVLETTDGVHGTVSEIANRNLNSIGSASAASVRNGG